MPKMERKETGIKGKGARNKVKDKGESRKEKGT